MLTYFHYYSFIFHSIGTKFLWYIVEDILYLGFEFQENIFINDCTGALQTWPFFQKNVNKLNPANGNPESMLWRHMKTVYRGVITDSEPIGISGLQYLHILRPETDGSYLPVLACRRISGRTHWRFLFANKLLFRSRFAQEPYYFFSCQNFI